MGVVVVRAQHQMKQTRAHQLTLHDPEDRAALRERPPHTIDVVAQPLLVIAIDAQRAEGAGLERVDVDRETEAVLRWTVRAAHVALRIRRREARLRDAEL